jgi:hypothetical protein
VSNEIGELRPKQSPGKPLEAQAILTEDQLIERLNDGQTIHRLSLTDFASRICN